MGRSLAYGLICRWRGGRRSERRVSQHTNLHWKKEPDGLTCKLNAPPCSYLEPGCESG